MDSHGSNLVLEEAMTLFVSSLSPDKRISRQRHLVRFVRWNGKSQVVGKLTPTDVAKYGEWIMSSTSDAREKLIPVKEFLTYAKKQKWTEISLVAHIRLKAKKQKSKRSGERQVRKYDAQHAVLTQQGFADLKAQLTSLREELPRIMEDVRNARADKDFKENAPLAAAREEKSFVEGKIQELETALKSAVVLDEQGERIDCKVHIGSNIVLCDLSTKEKMKYTLVDPREASIKNGKLSNASPVGKALLAHKEGDVVEISVPMGKLRYLIEEVVI